MSRCSAACRCQSLARLASQGDDALIKVLFAMLRAARFAFHLAYGLGLALLYPWLGLAIRRRILRSWCAKLLHIFNVHIEIAEDDLLHTFQHGLIVTNHISWLDVMVLNSMLPMRFVAKSEVRNWPVIGWLCARAQTLFIERGKARSAARINMQMVKLLKHGESLAIFPEGTTTDGKQVAHFHSSLLQPAIDAGVRVLPLAIRYQDACGTHSIVPAYIDDISFTTSLWNILRTRKLHVRLVASAPLDAAHADRRELTRMAQHAISATLHSMHEASFNTHLSDARHTVEPHETELHFQSLYCVLLNPQREQYSVRRHTE